MALKNWHCALDLEECTDDTREISNALTSRLDIFLLRNQTWYEVQKPISAARCCISYPSVKMLEAKSLDGAKRPWHLRFTSWAARCPLQLQIETL